MEESLIFLKPDAVLRRSIGASILQEFLKHDDQFSILAFKEIQVSEELAKKHYQEHEGKHFFPWLVKSIQAAPVLAMIIHGKIQQIRDFLGATFVQKANPHTIRGKYGIWGGVNSVHASDSVESGNRELNLWQIHTELKKDPRAKEKIKVYIESWTSDSQKDNTLKIRDLCRKFSEKKVTKDEIFGLLVNLLNLECQKSDPETIEQFANLIIENILI